MLMAFGGCSLAWILSASRPGVRKSRDLAVGNSLATAGGLYLLVVACAFSVDPPLSGFGAVDRASSKF